MPKLAMPSRDTQIRLVRFLVVGGTAAVVDLATFSTARLWLPQAATFVIAYVCSTTTHYLLNRFWALPSNRGDHGRQFVEYLGAAALNIGIRYALFWVCHAVLGLSEIVSYAIALPPTTVVIFLLLNYRVFRAHAKDERGGEAGAK